MTRRVGRRCLARWAIGLVVLGRSAATFAAAEGPVSVRSPDGTLDISLRAPAAGASAPAYRITCRGQAVVDDSSLGMTFADGGPLAGLGVTAVERASLDQTYPIPAGKSANGRDHCNAATVHLQERDGLRRQVDVELRAYDDAVAFRYVLPKQPNLDRFTLTSEDTRIVLPPAATAWPQVLPNFTSPYETYYPRTTLADLKPGQLVGLPLLVRHPSGVWLGITEADLTDYAGMYLRPVGDTAGTFVSTLSPLPGTSRAKVIGQAPHASPWRVFQVADAAAKLLESNVVLTLNAPCAITDTSWIKPGKVCFLWWNGYVVDGPRRQGGMDTATIEDYIDFAAESGFPYASIDGFDQAWYGGNNQPYDGADITKAVPSVDLPAVFRHARDKGVRMRVWVNSRGMMKYMDQALPLYEKWGVEGVMVDFVERDDQEMVRFLRRLIEQAAAHHLTVTLHNVSKPTGLSRTYPNLLTSEAVLNLEYDKWASPGHGSTPEHEVTAPFVRLLAGPMDYHTGGFRSVLPDAFRPRNVAPVVMGTRCHQLAMYVVYQNPMPMVADYPAAYRGQPGFDFLRQVPTTWDQTHAIGGDVGQWLAIARESGGTWYVGAMAGAAGRDLDVPLDFLGTGDWTAETWADASAEGPNSVKTAAQDVTAADHLSVHLSAAGGFVARMSPKIHSVARARP